MKVSNFHYIYENGTYEVLPNTAFNLICDNYNLERRRDYFMYTFTFPNGEKTVSI